MNELTSRHITAEQYPYLLKQISRQPKFLDVAGTFPGDEYTFLCVVGSRTYSTYGKSACEKLIQGLAGYHIVIVSGLAVGIDSIAHEAALAAGLKTVAFPGSGLGLDVLYPYSKKGLAQRILDARGAIVSPFARNQMGTLWTFPNRNRLMAAVSHATLIIEGRQGSGTLGTVDFATEFSRDVLAVPGEIFSELSYGPHMLIRAGATPITRSEDILQALGFTLSIVESEPRKKRSQRRNNQRTPSHQSETAELPFNLNSLILSSDEKSICDQLLLGRLNSTELIDRTSLTSTALNIAITELEMKNLIHEEGGIYRMRKC